MPLTINARGLLVLWLHLSNISPFVFFRACSIDDHRLSVLGRYIFMVCVTWYARTPPIQQKLKVAGGPQLRPTGWHPGPRRLAEKCAV